MRSIEIDILRVDFACWQRQLPWLQIPSDPLPASRRSPNRTRLPPPQSRPDWAAVLPGAPTAHQWPDDNTRTRINLPGTLRHSLKKQSSSWSKSFSPSKPFRSCPPFTGDQSNHGTIPESSEGCSSRKSGPIDSRAIRVFAPQQTAAALMPTRRAAVMSLVSSPT